MVASETEGKLNLLDGLGSEAEYEAVKSLAQLGPAFPDLLFRKYRDSKKRGERASCVYHSIKYAQNSRSSFRLGLEAFLSDPISSNDATAALDAIENMNQHYFVDREHSGIISLCVK